MQPDTQKIEVIKQEVDQFLYEQQEIIISSNDQYTQAGDTLKVVQNRIKKLEEKRKEYTQPLDESKKRIMADFQSISKPLEEFVGNVKTEMIKWARAEQQRKDEEQKKLEAEALTKAKAEGKSEVEVAIVNQEVKTQRGDVSTTTVKKVWKAEVINETEVPREYLTVNQVVINQAVRDGVRKIPGVRIYQDEQISIR